MEEKYKGIVHDVDGSAMVFLDDLLKGLKKQYKAAKRETIKKGGTKLGRQYQKGTMQGIALVWRDVTGEELKPGQ